MSDLYKYPRTPHLPFSKGATSDDKILKTTSHFNGKTIVVTEKMDGENTTIYNSYYHARSLDSKHKDYHSYLLTKILPVLQYQIPEGWRICGEYLYAKHSIYYDNLKDYFLTFSIWNEKNICLSWNETKEYCEILSINLVPELFVGKYDEKIVKEIAEKTVEKGGEGIVIRNFNEFSYKNFSQNIAKYVRKGHVQTDNHWSLSEITKNKLA
ncbi:RNA ligase family protein [Thomasclavelia cocleata]|uniref:RNA ligase family protein n=1 Tax=Thomasclavelia cocleata TaxID=69824 RepID=UPI00256EE15C|nr:RNA ligase family protein [Thomasclavelia cocleata]